jgi:hypothetical protein
MTVKELLEQITSLQDDIGCDGKTINSHDIQSSVNFWVMNDDTDYELVSIEPSILPCMCWAGINFILKKVESTDEN